MEDMITNFVTEFNKIGDKRWEIKGMPHALYYANIYFGVHRPTPEINWHLTDHEVQKRAVMEGIRYNMSYEFWSEAQKEEMKKLANKMFS